MRRNLLIIAGVAIAIPLLPLLLRKNAALLGVQSGKKIVAARSIIPSFNDGAVDVYVGKEKVFSLWEDWCDGPLFIYPFADNRRFFCDFDYDTAMLDFVVDLDTAHTNSPESAEWPLDRSLRIDLWRFATNVVLESKGVTRLASKEELDEVRDYLARTPAAKIKAASLPYCDLGFYRGFSGPDLLLLDLATNRQSAWPLRGSP
jgi:hypothetical protein